MYATCLFCNSALGANESIEHFPVGRRLAFDSATGRLWVVCRKCERWNLSPLETRWEAIEEAERAFRGTKLRVSTDNIGMAQLKDGTELVRIGAPLKQEFAAWRYGDQFGKRWRRYVVGSAAVAAAPTAQFVYQGITIGSFFLHFSYIDAGLLPLSMGGAGVMTVGAFFTIARSYRDRKAMVSVRDDAGTLLRVPRFWMDRSVLVKPEGAEDLSVGLMHLRTLPPMPASIASARLRQQPTKDVSLSTLTGAHALRALATILPHVNRGGGTQRTVNTALDAIADAKDLTGIFTNAPVRRWSGSIHTKKWEKNLSTMPAPIRLALEMSLHENDERRAMEGELKELEQRWREADAIAKIADEMFLPESVDEHMRMLHEKKTDAP